jgi:phosphoribosylanthranilate isomerase
MTPAREPVRVKICGITNLEDACCAVEAGTDLLGFVFYPSSPRFVPVERAAAIVCEVQRRYGPHTPRCVGVFVNEAIDRVQAILDRAALDLAQLHGAEPPAEVRQLQPRAFKAIRPQTAEEAEASATAYSAWVPDDDALPQLLLDAYHPVHLGGTGIPANQALAQALARRFRLLLAGGLTPERVGPIIRRARPWGVDVSTGVERTVGIKDHARVRAFVEAVRHAEAASGGGA